MDGLSAAWIDSQRTENLAAAQAAIDRFEAAAKREGLSSEHRLVEASLGEAGEPVQPHRAAVRYCGGRADRPPSGRCRTIS